MLSVEMAGEESLALVDTINLESVEPLLYYSSGYIRFLLSVAPGSKLRVFVARQDGQLMGCLPLLEQVAEPWGAVLNSMPFYGSHGGPCLKAGVDDVGAVQHALLQAATSYASDVGALSLTIIENPLAPVGSTVIAHVGLDVIDDRIGQFTRLPECLHEANDLLAIFHQKTRNAVRKGYQANQHVREATDAASLAWVRQVHADSLEKMGGLAKPQSVFDRLIEQFPLGGASKLHIGYVDGQPASGLLTLRFQRTVEYFTPVVTDQYKSHQVLSALIADVMRRSISEGYRIWNWGGTWRTQEGVYRFKSRFGATDHPYRYLGKIFDEAKLRELKQRKPGAFPYFYLYRY